MRTFALLTLLALGFTTSGCACGVLHFCIDDRYGTPTASEHIARELDRLYSGDPEAYMHSKPIAEQLDLYLWTGTYQHPPDIWLALIVADQGAAVVPEIKARLTHRRWGGLGLLSKPGFTSYV